MSNMASQIKASVEIEAFREEALKFLNQGHRQECIDAHHEITKLAAYIEAQRLLTGRGSSAELSRDDVDLLLETIQEKAEAILGDLTSS